MEKYLGAEEEKLLGEVSDCLRDILLIRLLFHLGCRIDKALAFDIEDVDTDRGSFSMAHLKSAVTSQ